VTSGITNVLIHVGEEGDHVVAHFRFDLKNSVDGKVSLGFDRGQGVLWHLSKAAVGLCGSDFHIQPALELRLLTPDGPHLGKGVTLDQGLTQPHNPMTL